MMKKGDFGAIFVVLTIAVGIFLIGMGSGGPQLLAEVTQDGAVLKRVVISGLAQPIELTVGGAFENKIVFGDGYAEFVQATCPNETCVAFGKLKRAGQVAVCAENRVTLAIKGQGALDAVVK